MNIEFTHPWVLIGAFTSFLPLIYPSQKPLLYSWAPLVPEDRFSRYLDTAIRLVAAGTVLTIVLGMAGPHRGEHEVEKIGFGAHVVLLLDRSASMNENFSGRHMGGKSNYSKGRIAQQLLSEFVRLRNSDLFALVAFSTSPIYSLPLTQDRNAIQAAILATSMRGRGITNIASGLAVALDFFTDQPVTGSRIILLVSDGAARIDVENQEKIRQWFRDNQVSLYWIFLRNPNSTRLSKRPSNPNEKTTPEYFLHEFFKTIDIPYQAYEAENPEALKQAIDDIGRLENKPIRYFEKVPTKDLSAVCYVIASLLLFALLLTKSLEITTWKP